MKVMMERLVRGMRAAHPATMIPIIEGDQIPMVGHNLGPGFGIVDREKSSRQPRFPPMKILNRRCARGPVEQGG
jgi:hypothetical protein